MHQLPACYRRLQNSGRESFDRSSVADVAHHQSLVCSKLPGCSEIDGDCPPCFQGAWHCALIPSRVFGSLSSQSRRQISSSRRVEVMAKCQISNIGISERLSRSSKCVSKLFNSASVGRRSRRRLLAISRRSRHVWRASSTISGETVCDRRSSPHAGLRRSR